MRTEIKLSLLIPIFSIGLFSIANCQSKTNQSKVKMPTLPKDGGSVGSSPSSEISLPTIFFKNNSGGSMITKDQMIVLDKIAASIKENPEGNIKVSGHGGADKDDQQSSWEQVNAIIRYLVEKKGISPSRFIFDYGSEGDSNTVDLLFTKESGPKSQPQPHPNLRRNL